MTCISTRSVFLALVAALVGCDSSPIICPCPSGGGVVTVPATPDATIDSVATEAPCSAQVADPSHVLVWRENSGTCPFSIRLTNGDAYAISVEFKSGGGCCSHTVFAVGQTTLTLVDGGTGG